ncbi:hypothetical protein PVK06_008688 [Gossypium arboreum]|uniref:Myb-like domain-containing protein n=1 Tax=Gossypium arboreum TaxID=29729 RepID=A0ABR0QKM9_GOSAR|nr:hypothetical protein PVK06_008688 [Gossypium arboreum]
MGRSPAQSSYDWSFGVLQQLLRTIGDLTKNGNGFSDSKKKKDLGSNFDGEGKEWNEAEIEILKKQMAKNPMGKPGRWEAIASSFKGKFKTDRVIKKAKELGDKENG